MARTGEQIAANKDGELSGPQTGLVGYWPMNEGTGMMLHDVSGAGRDVDLTSAGYTSAGWTNGRYSVASIIGSYRYAFNGKEKDQDIDQDDYDFGARIYDARTGRFLSIDPLNYQSPDLSPYLFAGNSPIANIDLNGLRKYYYSAVFDSKTHVVLKLVQVDSRHNDGLFDFSDSYYFSEWIGEKNVYGAFKQLSDLEKLVVGKTLAQVTSDAKAARNNRLAGYAEALNVAVDQQNQGFQESLQESIKADASFDNATNQASQSAGVSPTSISPGSTNQNANAANGGTLTKSRVNQIIEDINTSDYVKKNVLTVAVAQAKDARGKSFTLVGVNSSVTNDKKIMSALRETLKPNELLVPNAGTGNHAEGNIYDFAKRFGLTVSSIDPSRPFCADCNTLRKLNTSSTSTSSTNRKSKNRNGKN